MTKELALEAKNLTKTYIPKKGNPVQALKGVEVNIQPGKIHGLLGPNGAGKSTFISLISGMTIPTNGTVTIFGYDILKQREEAQKIIGLVPQEIVTEPAFTVEEVLYYFAGMLGVPSNQRKPRIDYVLESLSLQDKRNSRSRSLSGGMKRRLMIAKAIIHNPKFLILDEPTAGVDVALRQKVWDLIRELNRQGTTILFTTHYLEEAEQLCEYITLIDHGKVITEGTIKSLQQQFDQNVIYFELFDSKVSHPKNVQQTGIEYEMKATNLETDLNFLTTHYGKNLKSIRSQTASLEKIFLSLTTN